MVNLAELAQHLIDGHAGDVGRLTKQALDEGISPADILAQGLIAGMKVVGERFRDNIIFVPEVLVSARAMKAGMAYLEPILSACGIPPLGRFLIGTVKGDIHDIGKNLVGMMLKGVGFEIVDLGVNVPQEKFLAGVEKHRPHLLGMSALLTTTMGQMKVNIEAFRQRGLLDHMRVMVGGAPVSPEYAASIGADGYGKDATSAVSVALRLLEEAKAVRRSGG